MSALERLLEIERLCAQLQAARQRGDFDVELASPSEGSLHFFLNFVWLANTYYRNAVYLLLTTALCRCHRCWRKHKWNAGKFGFNWFTCWCVIVYLILSCYFNLPSNFQFISSVSQSRMDFLLFHRRAFLLVLQLYHNHINTSCRTRWHHSVYDVKVMTITRNKTTSLLWPTFYRERSITEGFRLHHISRALHHQ